MLNFLMNIKKKLAKSCGKNGEAKFPPLEANHVADKQVFLVYTEPVEVAAIFLDLFRPISYTPKYLRADTLKPCKLPPTLISE